MRPPSRGQFDPGYDALISSVIRRLYSPSPASSRDFFRESCDSAVPGLPSGPGLTIEQRLAGFRFCEEESHFSVGLAGRRGDQNRKRSVFQRSARILTASDHPRAGRLRHLPARAARRRSGGFRARLPLAANPRTSLEDAPFAVLFTSPTRSMVSPGPEGMNRTVVAASVRRSSLTRD